MNDDIPDRASRFGTIWRFVAGATALGTAILVAFGLFLNTRSSTEWWAQLGEAVGPVAVLFSAVALGAAVASVVMQTHELALQRREFQQSRLAQQSLAEETAKANAVADVANAVALLHARITITQAALSSMGHIGVVAIRAQARAEPVQLPLPDDQREIVDELANHLYTAKALHLQLGVGARAKRDG